MKKITELRTAYAVGQTNQTWIKVDGKVWLAEAGEWVGPGVWVTERRDGHTVSSQHFVPANAILVLKYEDVADEGDLAAFAQRVEAVPGAPKRKPGRPRKDAA